MRKALILSVFFGLSGCPPQPNQSPNPLPVPDSDLCGQMCDHLIQLGCDEGRPFYDSDLPGQRGIPNEDCETFCQKQQANGIYLNPKCVIQAKSCLEIEEVRQKDCSKDSGP